MSNKPELRPTNFVIVVDFDPDNVYLKNQSLLGWDNDTDWLDPYTYGDKIITPKNNIKRNRRGLIQVGKVGLYVGEKQSNVKLYSDDGNDEGYNCTICKLERNSDDDWIVVPV